MGDIVLESRIAKGERIKDFRENCLCCLSSTLKKWFYSPKCLKKNITAHLLIGQGAYKLCSNALPLHSCISSVWDLRHFCPECLFQITGNKIVWWLFIMFAVDIPGGSDIRVQNPIKMDTSTRGQCTTKHGKSIWGKVQLQRDQQLVTSA